MTDFTWYYASYCWEERSFEPLKTAVSKMETKVDEHLQRAGKGAQDADVFQRGAQIAVGRRLG